MAARSATEQQSQEMVPIFVMGKKFEVTPALTIQKALEYAGFQLVRGCGCRGGICGACTTAYRKPGSHRIEIGLACQTVVEPGMHLTQLPFFPALRAEYRLEELEPTAATVANLYPEIFKCLGCNTCTRGCPMDIDVMEYMSRAIRGDIAKVAELSFDCVMCGTCAARCPAETVQYNVGIVCRRLNGKYLTPQAVHLAEQVESLEAGTLEKSMKQVMSLSEKDLRQLYNNREIEPIGAPEEWTPKDASHL